VSTARISTSGPTATAEMRNRSGSSGVYHRACSFEGTIKNRVPREDWCRLEIIIPKNTRTILYLLRNFLIQANLLVSSRGTGKNSRIMTVR